MDVQAEQSPTLREVMGAYPTGVTIVAATEEDGSPFGLTVNSFTSVSLDPPLILVCVGHSTSSHDRLVAGRHFSVNVLAAGQGDLAVRFAREPSHGRFDIVEWAPGSDGAPLLGDTAATLECVVHEVLTGGDHSIIIGRVERADVSERPALLFHRGRFGVSDA